MITEIYFEPQFPDSGVSFKNIYIIIVIIIIIIIIINNNTLSMI